MSDTTYTHTSGLLADEWTERQRVNPRDEWEALNRVLALYLPDSADMRTLTELRSAVMALLNDALPDGQKFTPTDVQEIRLHAALFDGARHSKLAHAASKIAALLPP